MRSAREHIGIYVDVYSEFYTGTASVLRYADATEQKVTVVTNKPGMKPETHTVLVSEVRHIPGTPKELKPGKTRNRAWKRKMKKYLITEGSEG